MGTVAKVLSTRLQSHKGDVDYSCPSEACLGGNFESIDQKDTVSLLRRWQSSDTSFVLWKQGKLDVVLKNSTCTIE